MAANPMLIGGEWRVFCAVELPGELRARVGEHVSRLRAQFSEVGASWEKPEKLHVTLKFLGDIEQPRVAALSEAAARAVEGFEPFALIVEEAGTFPPRGLPRVLWLGVTDASGRLAHLQRRLEDECARLHFPREARAFHPHLTLARLRYPHGARELAQAHRDAGFEPQTFNVSELVVMRSELGPGGSRYTPVARHRF